MNTLEEWVFVKNLPTDVINKLVIRMKSEVYLTNDVIVVAGGLGNCMYFIHYGTVAVYTSTGKELCHLKDGANFGEISLIFQDPRTASVVAVTSCELFSLKRSDFFEVMNHYPRFKKKIVSMAKKNLLMSKSGESRKYETLMLSN